MKPDHLYSHNMTEHPAQKRFTFMTSGSTVIGRLGRRYKSSYTPLYVALFYINFDPILHISTYLRRFADRYKLTFATKRRTRTNMKLTAVLIVAFGSLVLASGPPRNKPFWHNCDECAEAWNDCLLVSIPPSKSSCLFNSSPAPKKGNPTSEHNREWENYCTGVVCSEPKDHLGHWCQLNCVCQWLCGRSIKAGICAVYPNGWPLPPGVDNCQTDDPEGPGPYGC